jgi:hypothetical protein
MKILLNGIVFIMIANSIYSQNLSRRVDFQISEDKIVLNNDFVIKIIDNKNDTVKLIPGLDNIIEIPHLFCNKSSYKVGFCYKNYNLFFTNVSGKDINFDVAWKFKILKYPYNNDKVLLSKIPKSTNEVFIWEFEPVDKDGWLIYEPNIKK